MTDAAQRETPAAEQPPSLQRAADVDPALTAVLVACLLGLGAVFFHYVLR